MKKILCMFASSFAFIAITLQPAFAEDLQGIHLNGAPMDLEQYELFIEGEQVMIPLRPTAEALGFQVVWDSETNSILLDNQSVQTKLTVGADKYYKQSSGALGLTQMVSLNHAPVVINGRVYVPLKLYDLLFSKQSTRVEDQMVYIEHQEAVALPNPVVEYQTFEDLQAACGFTFALPILPEGFEIENIMLIAGDVVSIHYVKDDQAINFRASQRTEDISGVYDVYEYSAFLDNAQIKGNGTLVHLALLTSEKITYSLHSKKGISREDMHAALQSLQSFIPHEASEG